MNRSSSFSGRLSVLQPLFRWFDSEAGPARVQMEHGKSVDWLRILPLVVLHFMCLGVIWVGWSPVAVSAAIFLYLLRMLEKMGIISDLRPVPTEIRSPSGKRYEHQQTGQDQARVEAGGE